MRVVILTTCTPHHVYLIGRVSEIFEIAAVFYETEPVASAFAIGPLFEAEEAEFEARHFHARPVGGIPTHDVPTVNTPGVAERIAAYGADVGVVFGCGRIHPHVFPVATSGLINVHRGVSERYRGLDSDLWAIHRGDPEGIGVTIHKVAEALDTGDILAEAMVPNATALQTHQLRYFTTVLAAELVIDVLREYAVSNALTGRPQRRGQYYSFMPLELKRTVRDSFDADHAPAADIANAADLFCFEQRIESQLCILLYHGVTRHVSAGIENFARKHLDARVFDEQMQYIARTCHVISIEEAVQLCTEDRPFPPRAVAVTFDDSFENVNSVAYPILKGYGIPFTLYVSTAFVGSDRLFWVDIIEDCVNRSRREAIVLPTYAEPVLLRSAAERIDACRSVKRRCKSVPNVTKDRIITALMAETGVSPAPTASPNYRMMSWEQLRTMAEDPLVTIGAHSHSHNVLSQIEPQELRREIEVSLGTLEAQLGRPIRHCSYPEGGREHFNKDVIGELKAHGVICCPTAICGLNPRGSDPFLLRRVMVGFEGMPFPYTEPLLNPAVSHSSPA